MMLSPDARPLSQSDRWAIGLICSLLVAFHLWAVTTGWSNRNMPGNEFRQNQTALSALFIQRDGNFSMAYPTPVLGKPWSLPMEFPLYQWCVVGLSDATGLPLIQAGRIVSLLWLYGAMAALHPLLGMLGMVAWRRLLVIGLMLTSPLYIFYSRAFLIETTALCLSLWFLVANGWLLDKPGAGRLALAMTLGVLAGLTKVTTFCVFLAPALCWACWRLTDHYRQGRRHAAARTAGWAVAAVLPAILATALWTHYADGIKAKNVSALFLQSADLMDFNFGNHGNRFSAATLQSHWQHISRGVTGPWMLLTALALVVTVSRHRLIPVLLGLGCYALSLAVFPSLYAYHDYYSLANGVLLLLVVGLALEGVAPTGSRWPLWLLLLVLHALQVRIYLQDFRSMQLGRSQGGSDMTRVVNQMTNPDDVVIGTGDDWSSSLPFYSERRALMVRRGKETDWAYLNQAFQALAGEKVAVYVAYGTDEADSGMLRLLGEKFGIDPRPIFRADHATVYGQAARRGEMIYAARHAHDIMGIQFDAEAARDDWTPVNREVRVDALLLADRDCFSECSPQPVKFFSQYGLRPTTQDGRKVLFSHPDTRLWFKVPPGPHVLTVECQMLPGSWECPVQDRSDGVGFQIRRETARGDEPLARLFLNPGQSAGDRGVHVLRAEVYSPTEETLVVAVDPGPAGNAVRDWAALGKIRLEGSKASWQP